MERTATLDKLPVAALLEMRQHATALRGLIARHHAGRRRCREASALIADIEASWWAIAPSQRPEGN